LLVRQLTCSEAFAAILRAHALHSKYIDQPNLQANLQNKLRRKGKIEGKVQTLQQRSVKFGSLDWR